MSWKFPDIQPGRSVLFLDSPTADLDSARNMMVLAVGEDVLEGMMFSREGRAMFVIRVTHIHDPRVADPQYVQSIMAEENAGFFIEQTRDLIIDERLNAIEAALASMTGKKTDAAPLVEAVKKLKELRDEPVESPGREVRKGKPVPLAKRENRKPLSEAEKAAKESALAEVLGV